MNKRLKRRKNETISMWLIRIANKFNMPKELTLLMFEVRKESFNEGFEIGKEIERIKNINKNEKD